MKRFYNNRRNLEYIFHLFNLFATLLLFWHFSFFTIALKSFSHLYALSKSLFSDSFYVFLLLHVIILSIYKLSNQNDDVSTIVYNQCLKITSSSELVTADTDYQCFKITAEVPVESLPEKQQQDPVVSSLEKQQDPVTDRVESWLEAQQNFCNSEVGDSSLIFEETVAEEPEPVMAVTETAVTETTTTTCCTTVTTTGDNKVSDEDPDYDDGEDKGMELIREKSFEQQSLRQQVADTNNVKQCNGGNSGVSNHGSMDSASSDSDPHPTHPPGNDPTSLLVSGRSGVGIDRRKVISIEDSSNPRRFVPQSVTREIISTVIARMPTPAAKWKDYPIEMKDELFKEFMGKYNFASDSERNIARIVWNRTCMDRYPDHLKNARKTALRQVNSTNLADTKGHGPKGLKPEVWNGLVDIWLKPEWMKKSDANRCNRAAKPDSALHTGGSISFREHKKRMEEEMKQEVSYRDVYAHVHKRKDGGYISRRSKKLIDLYDTMMLEKYGEDFSMHPEFDSEVWAEVSGMNKKRRAYEAPSLVIGNSRPMSTSHADAGGPSRTVAPTEEYIKEAVNTAMTSFVQTQLAPMLQPILSMIGNSMRQALSKGRVAEKDSDDDD